MNEAIEECLAEMDHYLRSTLVQHGIIYSLKFLSSHFVEFERPPIFKQNFTLSYLTRTLNHADFKIHVNALKAVKMESHMKMLAFA